MTELQLGPDDGQSTVVNTDYPLVTVTNPSDDNQLALDLLYQKIAVLETIEKLKNGAVQWSQVAPYQFHAAASAGSDNYDLYVTKFAVNGIVTYDVRKNGNPYYFVNSLMEPSLASLYSDLVDRQNNVGAERDKGLLQDLISQANVH